MGCSFAKFCAIDHLRCDIIYIPVLELIDLSWDGTMLKFKKYVKGPFYNTYFYLESVSKNRPLSHIKHSPHSNHGYPYND